VPIRALKALYRGKFQAKIKAFIESDEINIPKKETKGSLMALHRAVYKKEWSINIQEKYPHGKGIMNYLSRYLGASPIKPQQIIEANDKRIVFRYKDHRESKIKQLSLTPDEFMRRYLMHQAEIGVHTVRYYGLYSSQSKAKRQICENQLGLTNDQKKKQNELASLYLNNTLQDILCACCGAVMQPFLIRFKRSRIEKSINKVLPIILGDARSLIEPNLSG